MEPDFKIESRDADTEALGEEVSRRVKERREAGVYSPEVEALLSERLPDEEERIGTLSPIAELDYSATRALDSWAVTPAYEVATEKRFLKPLIIFVKRLARFWARVAVGPIVREQSDFNRHVARGLSALKEQAIQERARGLAGEEDLSLLIEPLVLEGESGELAGVAVDRLGPVERITVLGPCPKGLAAELESRGRKLTRVSAGTAWEETAGALRAAQAPLAYLEQLPDESINALLVPELAFWLAPGELVGLARRAYLVLSAKGRIAVAVHGFARGSPAPAWCDPKVIERALEMAGFSGITSVELSGRQEAPPGFVVTAGK